MTIMHGSGSSGATSTVWSYQGVSPPAGMPSCMEPLLQQTEPIKSDLILQPSQRVHPTVSDPAGASRHDSVKEVPPHRHQRGGPVLPAKRRLLSYAGSALLFSEAAVNSRLVSWNRVVSLVYDRE